MTQMILMSIVAIFVLAFGSFVLIPKVLAHYGVEYFDWEVGRRDNSLIAIAAFVAMALAMLFQNFQHPLTFTGGLGNSLVLVALWGVVRIDLAFHVIPDRLHLIGVLGAFCLAFPVIQKMGILFWMTNYVGPSLLLTAGLLFSNLLFKKMRKKQGIGLGDIKLLAWVGLLFGSNVLATLFLSSLIAGMVVVLMVFFRQSDWNERFAFGPYLAFATVLMLIIIY